MLWLALIVTLIIGIVFGFFLAVEWLGGDDK